MGTTPGVDWMGRAAAAAWAHSIFSAPFLGRPIPSNVTSVPSPPSIASFAAACDDRKVTCRWLAY